MSIQKSQSGKGGCLKLLVSQALIVPSPEQEHITCSEDGAEKAISWILPLWPVHSPKYCPVAGA